MRALIMKSLLTSLCQREVTPLWQRGARGDFSINVNSISRHLLSSTKKAKERL